MPFIKVKTSCPITEKQEAAIKSRIGKAIELVPGKSEAYLLLEFEDNCRLWLRGHNDEPIAYIEAAVFASESHCGHNALTSELTKIFEEILNLQKDHIYIKYEDIIAWGVQGMLIDRDQYW